MARPLNNRTFGMVAKVVREYAQALDAFDGHGVPPVIAEMFADELEHQSPMFDRTRFIESCLDHPSTSLESRRSIADTQGVGQTKPLSKRTVK